MATTIVTKSGSGAPTASDLVAGELAVDLTNGRLYTENSGGTVLELGLNPNGNVNVTGSVTADGLTISSTGEVVSTISSTSASGARGAKLRLNVASTGGDDPAGTIEFTYGTGYTVAGSIAMTHTNPAMKFLTGTTERMRLDANGNVGIGTASVSAPLHIKSSTANAISVQENGSATTGTGQVSRFISTTSDVTDVFDSNGYYRIGNSTNPVTGAGFSERMRIPSSGGIDITNGSVAISGDNYVYSYSGGSSGQVRSGMKLEGSTNTLEFYTNSVERIRIDANGRVTMPYQPAFYATPSSAQTGLLANDSAVTIAMGTEIFDVGSNFASSTFTAPVTGKYQLNLSLYMTTVDTGASYVLVGIVTSNRSYINIVSPKYASDPAYLTQNISTLADMDAGDTAYVYYQQSGGAAQTAVQDDTRGSFFQGYLVA